MVAAGTKLFIHGGLAGDRFFDDLHCIDIGKSVSGLVYSGFFPMCFEGIQLSSYVLVTFLDLMRPGLNCEE